MNELRNFYHIIIHGPLIGPTHMQNLAEEQLLDYSTIDIQYENLLRVSVRFTANYIIHNRRNYGKS